MAFSKEQQIATLVASQERYLREHGVTLEDPLSNLTSYNAVPSNRMRNPKVMDSSWTKHHFHDASGAIKSRPTRCVGGDVTVTYADGTQEVKSADSFRPESIHTKSRRVRVIAEAQVPEVLRYNVGNIGNVE